MREIGQLSPQKNIEMIKIRKYLITDFFCDDINLVKFFFDKDIYLGILLVIDVTIMNFQITKIKARWILDSRGNPTVECDMWAGDNTFVRAAVPSGASTGEAEAVELRDGDSSKFGGKGVSKAVANVNNQISKIVVGMNCDNQQKLDDAMIAGDGTPNKGNFGANAILSVSMCALKAAALIKGIPLYQHVYELAHGKSTVHQNSGFFVTNNSGISLAAAAEGR